MTDYQRAAQRWASLLREVPGAVDSIDRLVSRIKNAEAQYSRGHAGRPADFLGGVDVPNQGVGIVELGQLDSIAYWADKGKGVELFVHDFGYVRDVLAHPQPILAYATDGSGLVIARGSSRYRVTSRGIEG